MRRASAAHHLYASGAENPLPKRLVEVDGLDAGQWNLGHLDVEDAVLLHEAGVGDGKLAASPDDAAHYPNDESQHQQSDADVEERLLFLGLPVVGQKDASCSSQHKQQGEEEVTEDVRPVEPSLEDDCFAFLEALLNVIRHSSVGFQLQRYCLFPYETRNAAESFGFFAILFQSVLDASPPRSVGSSARGGFTLHGELAYTPRRIGLLSTENRLTLHGESADAPRCVEPPLSRGKSTPAASCHFFPPKIEKNFLRTFVFPNFFVTLQTHYTLYIYIL